MGSDSCVVKQSLVIPIRDEEHSIEPLVDRVHAVFSEWGFTEVIFVDDSDHTQGARAVAAAVSQLCNGVCRHLRVRHIHRTGVMRCGGLSGAVTDGLHAAESDVIVVMDGDLQHPPEVIPGMLEHLASSDIVIASRYIPGGSSDGLSGPVRHFVSQTATILAKVLFPVRLRGISDPMTGFFAIRKNAVLLDRLRPQGFKILAEILLAHPDIRRCEVPFDFAKRQTGESKGDARQGLLFFGQLLRHRVLP